MPGQPAFSRDQVRAGIDALDIAGYRHAAAAITALLAEHDRLADQAVQQENAGPAGPIHLTDTDGRWDGA